MSLAKEMLTIRMRHWDRLLQGRTVGVVDIDDGLRRLAADSGFQERIAYILLRSCAELLADGSESTRKHMQVAKKR